MHGKNHITLYSLPIVIIAALAMLFSAVTFSSYSLSSSFAQDESDVLSLDDEREDEEESEEEDEEESEEEDEFENEDKDTEDDGEDEDEDQDDSNIEDEDEFEYEDEDKFEDEDLNENELEKFLETQKKLQETTTESLKKMSERDGALKFLIGPDIESVKKLQEVIEANTRMLQQLQSLKQQVSSPEESQALESLESSIEEQNSVLNAEVNEEENTFSLFGWLLRLFK